MAFIVLSASSILISLFFERILSPGKKRKKIYCALMCILFVFFIGLRSYNIGTDSPGYVASFQNSPTISISTLRDIFSEKEPLFYTLQSLIHSITNSYTLWFLLIAVLYMVPSTIFIYKFSEIPYISFIIFMSMAYMNFVMAGLRQTIAAAFLIISFIFLFERKYIRFFIFVFVASGFHITSLIFLIVLFVSKKRIRIIHVILTAVATVMCVIFGKTWLSMIIEFLFGDTRSYSLNEFGGYSTLALFILVAIAALIFNRNITNKEVENDNADAFFFKFLLFAIPFQTLAVYQANCFRIAMYFSFFGMLIIIPKALIVQKNKTFRMISQVIVVSLLLVQLFALTYWISDVNPYEFFWQAT